MKVFINFLDGSFSETDLVEFKNLIEKQRIDLEIRNHPPRYICGIEELFPAITVFFSSDIVKGIVLGVITNSVYDVLKKMICCIQSKLKDKKLNKIQSNTIEQISPTFHVRLGKAEVILPNNVSDEKFKYCIDKLFDNINTENEGKFESEHIIIFDDTTGKVLFYQEEEYINKFYTKPALENQKSNT